MVEKIYLNTLSSIYYNMTRRIAAIQKAFSKPKIPSKDPLTEGIAGPRPKLILLDTCYFVSLARSDYPIRESLERLKGKSDSEIIVTSQVLDELRNIASSKRKADDGSLLVTNQQMCEVMQCVYEGVVSEEAPQISAAERAEAKATLLQNSNKNNSRVGEGELSLWSLARSLRDVFDCYIESIDSDVAALMAGL